MDTKACNLTEDEIWAVMQYHAQQICNTGPNYEAQIERLAYLNKRLKEFGKPKTEAAPVPPPVPVDGWGSTNGA